MKATIDRDGCISCELCTSICPNVFRMADDGIAEVYIQEIGKADEEAAVEAENSCPMAVITVEAE